MNITKRILLLLVLLLVMTGMKAQVSFIEKELNSDYLRGMELFSKEKYSAAIRFFDTYLKSELNKNSSSGADAEYYAALSALRLFNPDAEYRMSRFIAEHSESPRVNEARLALADYFYHNKNFRKAASYYELVNRLELEADALPAYYFKSGYSEFMRGDKSTALLRFSDIKDTDNDYSSPALYYFSHIAYEQAKYETALDGFMRLKNDETFGPVVPFYIAQVLYLKKDYDGILEVAPDLIKLAVKQRQVELYRFIGDAYYNKGNYTEAIPYLEKYSAGAKASGREDKYQLAYSYYKNREWDKAINIFLNLTASPDVMSQNIWCLLGDCYLQKGDKTRAQFAFGQASLMNHDKKLKEESLFNYAKLMYETSYSPFGEVINAFQEYIDLYPGSDRIEEVYNYLVDTYTQLKNYKAAIASLDKIRNKDSRLEAAYQRVTFFRGLELLRNLELQAAIDMFDKSLKYEQYSRPLRARAVYWRAEALYRLGDYDRAIADYQVFMGIPGSMLLQEYSLVRYNIGYSFFNKKNYSDALNHFKSFESGVAVSKPEIQADAMNRIADCYFITTNYPEAISFYNRVIDYGKTDADYAMYQKGFALGLTNNQAAKTDILTSLITKFPKSKYVPGAIFERGRAYVILKDSKRGEADFTNIISGYPNSPFVPRAYLQLGLLYFDTGENQKAIERFKKVIEDYKSTPESRYALTGLKNTYMEINDVESYFSYVRTLNGFGDINLAEKDSLLFNSGEKLYTAGNCERATEVLKSYIEQFANGSFRLNALYYLADCAEKNKRREEALGYYTEIIRTPNNEFIETSLLAVAGYYSEKEDYVKAFGYYEQLEKISEKQDIIKASLEGQLRSAYMAGDAMKTIAVATKISTATGIPEEMMREAVFMSAKAYYSLNRNDDAMREFRKIANEITTAAGAESKYRLAELLNSKGQTADAEKIINEFIDGTTPHQYWMARIFILLADISIKKGDQVQARATLQSLKDNYPVDSDGIIDEVKEKLDSLIVNKPGQSDSTSVGKEMPAPKAKP